ncbi:CPBP family intramembrane glutamic endopeptidase [Fictibacillus barbaricus]|uniref:Membrane protease YdiL (CAAX protease family) n=1 Tax=Fictibacillus barbaricus TaxID=182136 RepID=A0ABU1TWY9_9BACL|nr:CPBP family intramembrane glutamic endopeptidase [Fictibacillus barbaricus]MDR7071712.1 membrane protease YdiL (CAAX protease family) [Fictibacillus barbaricus]
MKKLIFGLVGFLLLDFYFNVTTHLISNTVIQFLCILLFFPLASYIAKLNGLPGLQGIGLAKTQNSRKYFLISLFIGFSVWTLLYITYWSFGKFEITGVQTGWNAGWILLQVLAGFFLGSFINDLITRGFVMNLLKGKMPPIVIMSISIIIYALDDFWNGDLSLMNFIFSFVLGCSLTYAFYKTGTIWADTGLHFGLNIAYGLLYGLIGKPGGGIILISKGEINPFINNTIVLMMTSLLFVIVYFYYRRKGQVAAETQIQGHFTLNSK